MDVAACNAGFVARGSLGVGVLEAEGRGGVILLRITSNDRGLDWISCFESDRGGDVKGQAGQHHWEESCTQRLSMQKYTFVPGSVMCGEKTEVTKV